MKLRVFAFFSGLLAMMACSSQRKLSHVETREPAAVRTEEALTPLREKIAKMNQFAKEGENFLKAFIKGLKI